MKTPFRLDDHPRRPQPLAAPPDGYFDHLPRRVMARVPPAASAAEAPVWRWLAALSAPVRTALAASVLLAGFAGSLWLSQPGPAPEVAASGASAQALAAVPQAELVEYLLASEQRVTLSDLAELPAAAQALPETYLRPSAAELQDALDAQPADETYL